MKGTQYYEKVLETTKGEFEQLVPKGYTDTDWAKEKGSRKSVSCGILMIGKTQVLTYSRGLLVVATSSDGADFYGFSGVASEAIFVIN